MILLKQPRDVFRTNRRSTGLLILTDISSQHIFYLFLLESSFDHKLVISIYGTTVKKRAEQKHNEDTNYLIFMNRMTVLTAVPRSQLSQQESEEMFGLTMQPVIERHERSGSGSNGQQTGIHTGGARLTVCRCL